MKQKPLLLLLAAMLIGSLAINTAQANHFKPQPKQGIIYRTPAPQQLTNPLRIHGGRLLNVQSLLNVGYMSTMTANAKPLTAKKSASQAGNSIVYVNRPNGWDLYGPILSIHFKDGTTTYVEIFNNVWPSSIPNGGSATFNVPDLSNIAYMEFSNLIGYPFDYTEYLTLSTDGGAVSTYATPSVNNHWIMEIYDVDYIKNGITVTVY